MKTHVEQSHNRERHYVCPLCDLAYCRHEDAMRRHFFKWHPTETVILQLQTGYRDMHNKKQNQPQLNPEHFNMKALDHQHNEAQVSKLITDD